MGKNGLSLFSNGPKLFLNPLSSGNCMKIGVGVFFFWVPTSFCTRVSSTHELPLLGVHDSGIARLLFGLLQMSTGIGTLGLVEVRVSYLGHLSYKKKYFCCRINYFHMLISMHGPIRTWFVFFFFLNYK